MRSQKVSDPSLDPKVLAVKVRQLSRRLRPLLPDMDAGDLMLILEHSIRPLGQGMRFFVREVAPGVYVP